MSRQAWISALILALATVTCGALLFAVVSMAFAGQTHTAYFPAIHSSRTGGLGLEIHDDELHPYEYDLGPIAPQYLRSNFGSWDTPNETLYLTYLASGWAGVDAEIVSDLETWRDIGAEPMVIFMRGGLPCKAPTIAQLKPYGDFIVAAVERYNLYIFEVWNEPDASGGLPSLFGCFGKAYADRLIYLLDYVQARVPSHRQVGVSFQAASPAQMAMLAAVASHADWVGVHYYPVYGGGIVQYPWPGGLMELVDMASQYHEDVRVTEFNLREPETICGPAFRQAQADEIQAALDLGLPMLSILVYAPGSDWQCTGIKDTPAEEVIMPGYP